MSEPARIGTWRSATALVRVNRGSTWTSLAPLSLAFMGQRNATGWRSEEHTSELQSRSDLVCRLLLEKKKKTEAVPNNRGDHDRLPEGGLAPRLHHNTEEARPLRHHARYIRLPGADRALTASNNQTSS